MARETTRRGIAPRENGTQPRVRTGLPPKQGLYDPWFEKDACGVGFVVHVKGHPSHRIVQQGLEILRNLTHRGACGCEPNTGDGAGLLIQIPHEFFRQEAGKAGFDLPAAGQYAVGMAYLPKDPAEQRACEEAFAAIAADEGQPVIGWRTVPTDNSMIGETALASEPAVRQVFLRRAPDVADDLAFERKLYVIRKRAHREIRGGGLAGHEFWYFSSLSSRTLVYKGMLMSEQLDQYYPDLNDPALASALALVHSRFSTNTFPSWGRAHPYRFVAHNGEINTLRGNVNWMNARQALFASELFGEDIKKVLPIIDPNGSDSAMFDNCLELLALSGRSLPHAVMMMIPEPWENHESMSPERKAFYHYHAALMEPWDGPASIAFTDGTCIGAVLDRNGLRPSRYYVTTDDLVIMASEVGVLPVEPENVLQKGRLQPGRMFLVDMKEGRIIADEEIKGRMTSAHPYQAWLDEHLVELEQLPEPPHIPAPDHKTVVQRQQAFGYTFEELRLLLAPMAQNGVEAVGSMGNDTPLAVLSERPQLLYNYFKQLFAQVTNPPIDCIREELITSAQTMIGSERNLLQPEPASCHMVQLPTPVLTNEDLARLLHVSQGAFKGTTLPILFDARSGGAGLEQAMDALFAAADAAIRDGVNILVLSDRGLGPDRAPVPALLAVAGLHHHLIRQGTRTRTSIVLESGEPREVHQYAVLIGYGCDAINPYLAFETIDDMIRQRLLTDIEPEKAHQNYTKAVVKGVVKVMSKMGISTVASYRGAQIFEAVGLHASVIDRYFTWTPSRVGGIGIDVIAEEVRLRHEAAYPDRQTNGRALPAGGSYQWRKDGEYHLFNPQTIHFLQQSARTGDYELYQSYAARVNDQSRNLCTLRGLLKFKHTKPVPIEEVEPVEAIMQRFKTGAMSYGSISREAHETLAIAMNRIGGKSNTGEGGEDPDRFNWSNERGDSKCSAIKQVASGRFGVTSQYLVNAKEIQIKMAQGAKPGEGGQLPGGKVYPWVAKVRHSTPGVGLISPPPHHDIYSIEDLAELIHDLKNANQHARICVKLVAEVGVGTIAAGVAKGHADVVLISGYDGGTGASPQTSIKHAGLPWELGLSETHQTLVLNNLRSRIVVETDGQMKTGRDVVVAALLGAEEFGFATAPLVTMGCVMMRVCQKNTCPTGVATQDPRLRELFTGDPDHVVNYFRFVAREIRELMAALGFRTINEMIGRTDMLEPNDAIRHWKAKGLDFSNILSRPDVGPEVGRYRQMDQDHGLAKSLDETVLLDLCRPAIENGETVRAELPIKNINRVVGTITGSELTRRHGPDGLPDDTIRIHFHGSAGQSFGAFMPRGMTFTLEGDANDYLGKGLSGGRLIVYPPRGSSFVAEENIIIGNVAFYGATGGEAFIRGVAGERFCVRNSGVVTVVEGVGDHGCEYMTGGRVVVLGPTGRNFAAGMSGGIAYVLDEAGDFESLRCNRQMVGIETLTDPVEIEEVRALVQRHADTTRSERALEMLVRWQEYVPRFRKVIPHDYKRVLEAMRKVVESGLTGDEAWMAAFEANARDLARVGGN
ncbi:MAG: glutamate synthase large subunit [Verrucomicrobiales bacterium]|nr:glutamate synthase large subunit [Verrucomicrobiales bacterium]